MATLRLKNQATGQIVDIEDDDKLEAAIVAQSLVAATEDELELWDKKQKYGGAGQTALAAGETALDTATFGALGKIEEAYGAKEDFEGRREVLGREHQGIDFVAQAAGATAVGLAGGAVLGGAAKAVGAGAKLAQAASIVGEGATSGLADEVQMASRQGRDVSVGNAIMMGVGGELIGRAIPAAFSRALSGKALAKGVDGAPLAQVTPDLETPGIAGKLDDAADAPIQAKPGLDDYGAALEGGGLQGAIGRSAKRVEDKTASGVLSQKVLDERVIRARRMEAGPERLAEMAEVGDVIIAQEAKQIAERVGPAELLARGFNDRGNNANSRRVLSKQLQEVPRDVLPAQVDAFRSLDAHLDDMSREFVESRVSDLTRTRRAWTNLESARQVYAKEIRQKTIDPDASDADVTAWQVDMMQATRKYKQSLQSTHTSLADMKAAKTFDSEDLADFQRLVDAEELPIRKFMEDQALFGDAAKTEAAINLNFHENLMPRVGFRDKGVRSITGRSYDAQAGGGRRVQELDRGKIESMLGSSEGGRDLQRKAGLQEAQYYEKTAEIHGPEGTGLMTDAQVAQMKDAAEGIRGSFEIADEVASARVLKSHTEKASGGDSGILGKVAGALGGAVAGVPGAGHLMRGAGLFSVNDAAKGRFLRAAQRVAKGAAAASDNVSRLGGAPVAATALSRFTGTYPTPESSYEAKRTIIEDAMRDPATTAEAMASSMMRIAESDPDLFAGLAGRQMEMMRYVVQNLPTGVQVTLEHPNGVPPSESELREFAVLWNAVFEPQSVIEGIESMSTTAKGWMHLQSVHQDIANEFQQTLVEELQINPAAVPSESKTYLQNTMDLGELFGGVYSDRMSVALDMTMPPDNQKQRDPGGPLLSETEGAGGSQQASGLSAIQSSVTNAS